MVISIFLNYQQQQISVYAQQVVKVSRRSDGGKSTKMSFKNVRYGSQKTVSNHLNQFRSREHRKLHFRESNFTNFLGGMPPDPPGVCAPARNACTSSANGAHPPAVPLKTLHNTDRLFKGTNNNLQKYSMFFNFNYFT